MFTLKCPQFKLFEALYVQFFLNVFILLHYIIFFEIYQATLINFETTSASHTTQSSGFIAPFPMYLSTMKRYKQVQFVQH